MKSLRIFSAALLFVPFVVLADESVVGATPERCFTVANGVTETSKQLKELSGEMGWDLGTFKAMKVSGVVKGRLMASDSQVDVCLKEMDAELKYQIRSGSPDANHQLLALSEDRLLLCNLQPFLFDIRDV